MVGWKAKAWLRMLMRVVEENVEDVFSHLFSFDFLSLYLEMLEKSDVR